MTGTTGYRRYFILIAAALMAIGLQVLFATAQTSDTEVELVGLVEAMDANTITINGQVINLAGTEINTPLTIGAAVQVEGTIGPDGQITAREVGAVDQFEPNAVEVTGVVQSFDGATLALAGLTINAVDAEFDANAVVPGALVRVHIVQGDDGSLTMSEISVVDADNGDDENDDSNDDANDDGNGDNEDAANNENGDDGNDDANDDDDENNGNGNDDNGDLGTLPNDEFEIVGTLESVGNGTITVFGQTVDITQTEIQDALIPGTLVKVHAMFVNGQLVAHEVEFADLDDLEGGNADNGDNGADNEDGNNESVNLISTCGVPAGWTTYTIRSGDSLSSIAVRTGTTVDGLTSGNCISVTQLLLPGQAIAVPQAPVDLGGANNNDDFDNSDNGDNGDNIDAENNDNDDNGDDDNGDDNAGNNDDNGDDNGGNRGPGGGGDDDGGNSGSGGGDDDGGGNSGHGGGDD